MSTPSDTRRISTNPVGPNKKALGSPTNSSATSFASQNSAIQTGQQIPAPPKAPIKYAQGSDPIRKFELI